MNCDRVNDLLESYQDDLLDPADRGTVESHLEDCPGCRLQMKHAQDIEAILEDVREQVRPAAVAPARRVRLWDRLPMAVAAVLTLSLLGTFLTVARPPELVRSAKSGKWSEAATWEGGAVPGAGARVQVRAGHAVLYDVVSDKAIRLLHVAGTLDVATDRDTRLDVGLVKVQSGDDVTEDGFSCDAKVRAAPGGEKPTFRVGRADAPVDAKHTALIRLVYFEGMDRKTCPAIVTCGGRVEYHGAPMNRTWVKLAQTAAAGSTDVLLSEPVSGWKAGHKVILTATQQDHGKNRSGERATLRQGLNNSRTVYTEERRIEAIDGTKVRLDRPLEYEHLGAGDYRGEIANLSRNVIVESADPSKERGHTMWHRHSAGGVSYAEFRHLGKEGVLGKYSLHFHLVGNSMRGAQVLGASIWDSGNRWITIHGTNYMVVRDCVGYQSVGHGFFLEDGTEVYNVLDRNLAVQAFKGRRLPGQVLPFDANDGAGFWWANNLNTFTRNVSCENDRYGYRAEATPSSKLDLRMPILQPDGEYKTVDIRTLPFVRFDDNESHSDGFYGFRLGECVPEAQRLGPDASHPHMIRNLKIWDVHYGFRPEIPALLVENLNLWKADYGVYHPDYDRHVYRNISIRDSRTEAFNRGHDDENRQFGPLTVEGMTIEGGRNHVFQVSQRAPHGNADSHFRNVTIKDSSSNLGLVDVPPNGKQKQPPPLDPVPYYFHDWFGPGRHAKILTADMVEKAKDGLTYVDSPFPFFGKTMKMAEVKDVPFPNLLTPVDDLPPTTVITSVRANVVRGTTSDNGEVKRVLVNGRDARATAPNFAEWEATLEDASKLEAWAEDAAGNTERLRHSNR
jgi:hypothetical protein